MNPIARLLLILFACGASPMVSAAIVDKAQHEGIVYLVDQGNRRVLRYDIDAGRWLRPIRPTYPYTPKFVTVSRRGIFVGFNRAIYRYGLNGRNEVAVAETAGSIFDIQTLDDLLFVSYGRYGKYLVFNARTLAQTDSGETYEDCEGMSAAPTLMRIYCRDYNDIFQFQFDAAGKVTNVVERYTSYLYQAPRRTWVLPGEQLVAEGNGVVYEAEGLLQVNGLPGDLDELVTSDGRIIARSGKTLVAYSARLRESGVYELSDHADALGVSANTIVAFFQDSANIRTEKISLNDFAVRHRERRVDPTSLAYTPDSYALDADRRILYLLSKTYSNIFLWSIDEAKYLPSIRLAASPEYMAIDTQNSAIYVAYKSGRIDRIDLDNSWRRHIATLPHPPQGLAVVGNFIFAVDYSSDGDRTHYTFNSGNGEQISAVERYYDSDTYVWSQDGSRLYYFDDKNYPSDLIREKIDSATGVIGGKHETPTHSSNGIQYPIHIWPDGGLALLGSGRIYDARSLERVNSLGSSHFDAAWPNGQLHTLEQQSDTYFVQQWSPTLQRVRKFPMVGDPLEIFDVNGTPLVVYSVDGVPQFGTDLARLDGDSDDDGVVDSEDVFPDDPEEYADSDGDGMPDNYEIRFAFDPRNPSDASDDADGDGESNVDEFRIGADPRDASSNLRVRLNGVNTIVNTLLQD